LLNNFAILHVSNPPSSNLTIIGCLEEEGLDFIVEYQDECTSSTTEHVGEIALEERRGALLLADLAPAVDGVLVHDVPSLAAGLHHHTTTNSVEWIRDDARNGSDGLSNRPTDEDVGVLGIGKHTLGGIEEAEVRGTIDNNTLNGYGETTVESDNTIRLGDLSQTIQKTVEFSLSTLADIGTETCSGEIKRIYQTERCGSGSSTGCQVTGKVAPELCLLVNSTEEDLLILVLEGEVQSLSREVPDHIGEISSPESREPLFLGDTNETINDTLVLVLLGNLLGCCLNLEKELDTLNWGDSGLRNGGSNTTGNEILGEGHGIKSLLGTTLLRRITTFSHFC